MAGRVVSSGGEPGRGPERGNRGRLVRRAQPSKPSQPPRRQPRKTVSGSSADPSRSKPGAFVDARRLSSEDLVAKTLRENSGTLGLATRPKVVDFTARARERKRAGVRAIALRAGIAALAVVLVVGLCWLLFLSPALRLDASQVTVTGANKWVSESDIRDIVDEQTGRSLVLVNTSDMTERMSSIPGVTSATATKRWPHGLAVAVESQRPAAMLKASGGDSMTAVDSKARVLNSVAGASVDGIPVIEVKDVSAGLKRRAVKEALKVLDSLPESMRNRITKVTAATQDSITTQLDGGKHTVVWGDSSQMKLKKAVVDKILSDKKVIGDKTEVDVSAPLRPVLR
ncbi:FtsQ-type POTRA domain-containing protein [Bifidobacterium sp. MA2]|uniref:FtsQ-type POTRA domain-containing protein n=1 Tax=Bifidobacterium santillanense TaxID=2809028 RepID=A0ABS5UMV7_9BIFI|nr:FtsQ-type POTRA domain-containing protein [Bifidobacterium santillanense]MBT1172251.1 FtsQ-type POTRA domain-containing protein [Bifidobacterium santillanense]